MRSFGRLGVVLAAVAVAMFLCAGGPPVFADMISTTPVSETASSAPPADRAVVESQLHSLGLTTAEAQQRLTRLTDEEVTRLAGSPQQVQMAGNPWIILGVGLVIAILAFWFIESYYQREKNKA